MHPYRIGIIGGGPGGLMTAHLLQKRSAQPIDVTIIEATNRLGGKILTGQFSTAPVSYEAGAAELYDYTQLGPDPLRELVAELGLSTSPMSGPAVVIDDCILRDAGDLRKVFGPKSWNAYRQFVRRARAHISRSEYYESDWREDNLDPLAGRTFSALLDKIPDEAARRYIRVVMHSDMATEPHETNAIYGLQNFLMCEPDYMQLYTIDGGIERLPRELARRINARVLLDHAVARVERNGPKYRVVSRHHGETQPAEEFDFLVVALPNSWIPLIEWGDDTLAKAMRKHHSFYNRPAHYLRVSMLFDRPVWRDVIADSFFMLDAFGGCCVYDESARSSCGQYGVLGWLLAGADALLLSNFSDDVLIEKALESLPTILRNRCRSAFLEGRVHRWTGSVNGLPAGFPAREPDSRHVPEPVGNPELFVVGDYLFDSTLNGVLDSADVVAEWIVEEITPEPAPALVQPTSAAEPPPNGKLPHITPMPRLSATAAD